MEQKKDFVELLLEWYAKQTEIKNKGVVQNAQVQSGGNVQRP